MGMKCLIIAAGKGSRLRQQGDSKPLIPILGLPLIERVIRSAIEAGADDFYVVTGYQEGRIHSFLANLTHNSFIDVEDVTRVKTNGDKILNASKRDLPVHLWPSDMSPACIAIIISECYIGSLGGYHEYSC